MRSSMFKVLLLALLAMPLGEPAAHAAFPGANGKIVFSADVGPLDGFCHCEIDTINPDGSGRNALTSTAESNLSPAWSADGQKIAFVRNPSTDVNAPGWREGNEIWIMNADGSGQLRVTNNAAEDLEPAWSPDGSKIVFVSRRDGNYEIYVMNADGSGQTRLTSNTAMDLDPEWSPNGQEIVFSRSLHIWKMSADGLVQVPLTTNPPCSFDCFFDAGAPSWSPDGSKIVFSRDHVVDTEYQATDLWLVNSDGTNVRQLTDDHGTTGDNDGAAWSPDGKKIADGAGSISVRNADGTGWMHLAFASGSDPSWQPLPTAAYEHPQSASSLSASLVPTFRPCGTGANPTNGQHSPPLGTQACLPPTPGSNVARVGSTSVGTASFTVVSGDSDPTDGDQANVTLWASLSDVRTTAGADYVPNASGPDLTEITRLRFTDKGNNYGGASGTATEYDFHVPLNCVATSDPSTGSTCSTSTSADSLLPGFVTEQRQTVVQAFRVRVDDAGTNGTTGDSDDRIFATQGIYVP